MPAALRDVRVLLVAAVAIAGAAWSASASAPAAPVLTLSVQGTRVSASWSAVSGATGYRLYYAPYPRAEHIAHIEMGLATEISAHLPLGATFYVAVRAVNADGEGPLSNVRSFAVTPADTETSYENFKGIGLVPQVLPWDDFVGKSARAYADFSRRGVVDLFVARQLYPLPRPGDPFPTGPLPLSRFEFWRKQPDGTFVHDRSLLPLSDVGCLQPAKPVVADFNRDGRPDVFVSCSGYDGDPFPGEQNKVVLSQPNGTYVIRDASPDVGFHHAATAADLNGDGHVDVVLVNFKIPAQAYVLLNRGDGTFEREPRSRLPASITRRGPYLTVELVDVDQDGKLDLLLGGIEPNAETLVFLNPGNNDFSSVTPRKIAAVPGDSNVLDFVVTGSGESRAIWVYRTTEGGNGEFYYQSRTIQKVRWPTLESSIVYSRRRIQSIRWIIPTVVNGAPVIASDDARDGIAIPLSSP